MSSIKCSNCDLINFASDPCCKRCKSTLSEISVLKNERAYHLKTLVFQSPPPPPRFHGTEVSSSNAEIYCLKCGSKENLSAQTFQKKFVSPVAILGIVLGPLVYFLLRLLLTTKHEISAPFCDSCWQKFNRNSKLLKISHLGIAVSLLLGIVVAVILDSPASFFIIFGLAIIFWIYTIILEKASSPKYKKIDDKRVIIDAPQIGEISFDK